MMRLNINAKELLALHNVLHERYSEPSKQLASNDPRAGDDVQLRQIYNRLRACIMSALSGKVVDPIDAFLSHEQDKIDRLKDQSEKVEKDQSNLVSSSNCSDFFIPVEWEEDYQMSEYPRRGIRSRTGNKSNGKR